MYFMHMIGYGGMLCSFLPVMLRLKLFTGGLELADTPLQLSVKDETYEFSIILGIGVIIPFFIELLLDIFTQYLKRRARPFAMIILRW